MPNSLISDELRVFLEKREFLYIATTDAKGTANVAPKFLVKTEGDLIYLADFVLGKTLQNLRTNHYASVAASDNDTLVGYQINGPVHILEKGAEYEDVVSALKKREIQFSVERVIKSIERGKKFETHEVVFPDHLVVFKFKAEEIVKISPTGKLERKSLDLPL